MEGQTATRTLQLRTMQFRLPTSALFAAALLAAAATLTSCQQAADEFMAGYNEARYGQQAFPQQRAMRGGQLGFAPQRGMRPRPGGAPQGMPAGHPGAALPSAPHPGYADEYYGQPATGMYDGGMYDGGYEEPYGLRASSLPPDFRIDYADGLASGGSGYAPTDPNTYTSGDRFADVIGGGERFHDPYNGGTTVLDGYSDFTYYDQNTGEYYQTDDPNFDPYSLGGDFQQVQPMSGGSGTYGGGSSFGGTGIRTATDHLAIASGITD